MAYQITETRVLFVYKMKSDRRDYLKVSDFFMDNDEYTTNDEEYCKLKAEEHIKEKGYAKEWDIEVLYAHNITYEKQIIEIIDGKERAYNKTFSVKAEDVHEVLLNSNVIHKYFARAEKDIWFKTDMQTVTLAITAVTGNRRSLLEDYVDDGLPVIKFRPEQELAIDSAIDKFTTKTGKKYLWNAKMRFGKTLCALEVIRRQNYKSTLIVTHRPDVDSNWYKDFQKIFCHNNNGETDKDGVALIPYSYGSRSLESQAGDDFYTLREGAEEKHFVFFVSMQFLRLSTLVNDGEGADDNPLKKDIMLYDWDFVVVDEAHEGTRTSLGSRVIEILKKEDTRMLSLSGTPFNLYDDFEEDEIYTWDYVSEQQAKKEWEDKNFGDPNPYDVLPQMQIFVYKLGDLVTDLGEDEVDKFKFSEFFRVWTGDPKKDHAKMPSADCQGKFIHEDDVNRFLNKLVDGESDKKFPYAPDVFKECFQHTLWIIPGVKEAKALEALLKQHDSFCEANNVKVINVAGEGSDEENRKALEAVNVAMRDYDYTITLSCGRLTTGVSVPNWTAVFYLKGSESTTAATFMQTIFRSQTHAVFGEGKQKRYCYVFDFAPERTLKVIAETAKMSVEVKKDNKVDRTTAEDEEKQQMEDFLALCPIKSLDTGDMEHYDAGRLFRQLKKVYIERAVYSGFGDDSIYKMDELMHLDPDLLERMGKITGKMTKFKVGKISRDAKPLTEGEKKKIKEARKQKREGEELTKEQRDLLEKERQEREEKKNRASTLRALAIRIPLLMYGAELTDGVEAITLDNFTDDTIVDNASWDEFMPTGVTKEMFNKLKTAIDPDVFMEAGKRYRSMAKKADDLDIEDRIDHIATIFSLFHNPDKETVLTPWRVVNMHMSHTLGGWCFFNEKFDGHNTIEDENHNEIETIEPRWVDQGKVTTDIFCDYNSRILEINSKTGLYPLYMAYSLFKCIKEPAYKKVGLTKDRAIVNNDENKERYSKQKIEDLEIWKDILQDNLFVVCRTKMAVNITKRTLAGFQNFTMNVKCYEKEVPINDLITAGIIKKTDSGVSKRDKTYYLFDKRTKKCDIIDVLRSKSDLFENDVVLGNDFWQVYNSIPLKQNENINNMKFNVVVGNPPYQMSVAKKETDNGQKAVVNIFHHFQIASDKIANYTSLIYPGGRWIHRSGKGRGLSQFGLDQINDTHLKKVIFYPDANQVFTKVDIPDGITLVFKDMTKTESGFEYAYKDKRTSYSIAASNPGAALMPLDLMNESIIACISKGLEENDFKYLHDSVLPRSLFSIESDFVEKNPSLVRFYNDGDAFDLNSEIKLFTNDKGGKAGRARWYIAKKDVITTGRNYLNKWKVVVSSANAGGQKRQNQLEILDNHSAFGRSRVALKTFDTEAEARNFYKYVESDLIRFTFLLTDENLTSLAKQVPDILNYKDDNGYIDFSKEVDPQLYKLFGIEEKEQKHIKDVLSKR